MFRPEPTVILTLLLLVACGGPTESEKEAPVSLDERMRELVYFTNSDEGLSIAEAVVEELVHDSHEALHWMDYDEFDAPERLVRRSLERAFK